MIKTILIPVLVGSFAVCVRAAGADGSAAGRMVPSSQDFESCTPGSSTVPSDPEGGRYYWRVPDDPSMVKTVVVEQSPNLYLDVETSELPAEGLVRLLVPRKSPDEPVTNAFTSVDGDYDGFYCRFRAKIQLFDVGHRPEVDGQDRLVLWAVRDSASGPGRLYVTAGRFTGGVDEVEPYDYPVSGIALAPDSWHEVTLRVIPDVRSGSRALGFEIWLDDSPLVADGDYPLFGGSVDVSAFTSEARALAAQRRLFPSLTRPGVNESVALGGVAFTGSGSVDDFGYAFAAPEPWAEPPRVFTLRWDAGVKTLNYRIGSSASVSVSTAGRREAVFEIPKSVTDVKVSATYDTAGDYSAGVWGAEGACTLLDAATFRCDASSAAATGFVRSSRPEIGLGGGAGSFASFADAKEQAIAQGVETIVLNGDFTVSDDTRDAGRIEIAKGEQLTIDLKGHVLGTSSGEYPTIVNHGTLTIVDSEGGGRVRPFADYFGDEVDFRRTAVQNYASALSVPVLTICGGVYDGAINNSGIVIDRDTGDRLEGTLVIVRNAGSPSEPQFIGDGGGEFAFGGKLEDPRLYYSYEEPYWKPLTNAFVWCGKGLDDRWSNPENWRCGEVPGENDYAVFPTTGDTAWEADMESGIAVRDIWFAGDVILHGSNDFTAVRWKADGRIRGDAILVWSGSLPPDLSSLLDERWAGTVSVVGVGNASPKLLGGMSGWGTKGSTVCFSGVRGYYQANSNLTLPYTLELVNGPGGYGWKNDAGFTGGVIEFPRLVGTGDFLSPSNTVANRQLIIFRDVMSYYGSISMYGKRALLGPGEAVTTEHGSITWSDGLRLRTGFLHSCRVAAFGGSMEVYGSYGDTLGRYTDAAVGASAEVVRLMPGEVIAELCVTNPVGMVKLAPWSEDAVIVGGRRVASAEVGPLNSQSAVSAPAKSMSLNRLSVAAYYTPSVRIEGGLATMRFALNEHAVPVIGASGGESAAVTFVDGMAVVVVSGVIDGFWYGLEYKASLDDDWPGRPYIWTVAEPGVGKAELVAPAEGPSGFYRVVVSDVKPEEGGDE